MANYDWDYWRHQYVAGDDSVTLEALAMRPNAPSLTSLKRRSTAESWPKQRNNFRLRKDTVVSSDPAAIQAVEKVRQLVDVAEMITRQSQVAREFQELAAQWARQAEPSRLKGAEAIAMFRDAAKVEQLLAGLATEHADITSGGKPLTPTRIEIVAPNVNGSDTATA